jgi:uncharacterized protein (TIGR03437 family)
LTAVVPSGINVNTSQQILIRRGVTLSRPVAVDVAPAQPAVFIEQDRPVILHSGPPEAVVSVESPAKAGDALTIHSSGLGPTNPQVPDGNGAPADPLAAAAETVEVTIGGVPAPVSFAGLSPGLAAHYQIKVTVPEGVTPGDEVPVVIRVAGQVSPTVTIPVR